MHARGSASSGLVPSKDTVLYSLRKLEIYDEEEEVESAMARDQLESGLLVVAVPFELDGVDIRRAKQRGCNSS